MRIRVRTTLLAAALAGSSVFGALAGVASAAPSAPANGATTDRVQIPGGTADRVCVHGVPAGGRVLANGDIAVGTRVVPVARCAHPVTVNTRGGATRSAGPPPPATKGWLQASWWDSATWVRRLYSNMAVPAFPASAGQQLNYFFSSFQSTAAIVQPVLQWGTSPAGGGQYYAIASWYVLSDGRAYYSALQRVQPGDTIYGQMEANSCTANGAGCHWTIVATDTTGTLPGTRLDITASSVFTSVQGGVFESYGAAGCAQLPANGHAAWRKIQVWGPTFNPVTPSFRKAVFDQECSMNTTFSSTGTDIVWAP